MSFNILGDHKLDIDVKLIKRVNGKKDQIFNYMNFDKLREYKNKKI